MTTPAALEGDLVARLEAYTPRVGKWVKVIRGTAVAIGTVGRIFWVGPSNYGGSRLGIRVGKSATYVDAENVTVLPEPT